VRIPAESDHHSGVKATAVPPGIRPAFRWDSDRRSGMKATGVPEQSDRLDDVVAG